MASKSRYGLCSLVALLEGYVPSCVLVAYLAVNITLDFILAIMLSTR